jgi:hypothetical protein
MQTVLLEIVAAFFRDPLKQLKLHLHLMFQPLGTIPKQRFSQKELTSTFTFLVSPLYTY